MDADQLRTIVGVIGNVISLCLFLSPMPTILTIIKGKSVQEYKPDPYVATVLNCAMWVFYGLPIVHPDSLLVVTINGTGLVIEIIYVIIFFVYSDPTKKKKIISFILAESVLFTIIVLITLLCLEGTDARSMLVGLAALVLNIIMYASPLTVMKTVITTKSVKYMPLPLSLANLCNGCVWLAFALIKFDPYILIPNGLGVFSGIIQVCLYAKYYGTTNWDEDEEKKESKSIEMS